MKRFLFVVATTSAKAAGITIPSKTAGTLFAFLRELFGLLLS
jgi:hypothetical protein